MEACDLWNFGFSLCNVTWVLFGSCCSWFPTTSDYIHTTKFCAALGHHHPWASLNCKTIHWKHRFIKVQGGLGAYAPPMNELLSSGTFERPEKRREKVNWIAYPISPTLRLILPSRRVQCSSCTANQRSFAGQYVKIGCKVVQLIRFADGWGSRALNWTTLHLIFSLVCDGWQCS